jgi:FkbM family methyltransferase
MNTIAWKPLDVFKKIVRNLSQLPKLIWSRVKYARQEKTNLTIGGDVWSTQIMRQLGRRVSVHDTEFAIRENQKLMSQFVSQNGFDLIKLVGGVIELPPVPNAREVVVNDLREIFVENIYEYGQVRVRPNDVVVDCGANIGLFSLLALNRVGAGGQLIAVEPAPCILTVLEKNLSKANLLGKYRICERAISSNAGTSSLVLDEDVFTMHRLNAEHSCTAASPSTVTVQTTTIDNLASELQLPRVDFIKMDIEGAEIAALHGSARVLKQWKPRLAISAYHKFDDFYEIPQLISKINPSYRIHVSRNLSPLCYAW